MVSQELFEQNPASLGMHVHNSFQDFDGEFGLAPFGGRGPDACDAFDGDPMAEAASEFLNGVLSVGVQGSVAFGEMVGVPVTSFTGHLPRRMSNKIDFVGDPSAFAGTEISFSHICGWLLEGLSARPSMYLRECRPCIPLCVLRFAACGLVF